MQLSVYWVLCSPLPTCFWKLSQTWNILGFRSVSLGQIEENWIVKVESVQQDLSPVSSGEEKKVKTKFYRLFLMKSDVNIKLLKHSGVSRKLQKDTMNASHDYICSSMIIFVAELLQLSHWDHLNKIQGPNVALNSLISLYWRSSLLLYVACTIN